MSQFGFKVEIGGGRKGGEAGGGGLKTPDNSTDIRLKTAKNNIGKPQTALNSKYPKPFCFVKLQYRK